MKPTRFPFVALFCIIFANPIRDIQYSNDCFKFDGDLTTSDDCIKFISEKRNISLVQSRSVFKEIFRLVKSIEMTIDSYYITIEGFFLSNYALKKYHFPNHYGELIHCDDAYCKNNFNVFSNASISDIFNLCLIFCSKPLNILDNSTTGNLSNLSIPDIIFSNSTATISTSGIPLHIFILSLFMFSLIALIIGLAFGIICSQNLRNFRITSVQ